MENKQLDFRNNKYEWKPEDNFTFTGVEFSMLFNQLQVFVNQPKVQETMALVGLYKVLENKFQQAVNEGVINVEPVSYEKVKTEEYINYSEEKDSVHIMD